MGNSSEYFLIPLRRWEHVVMVSSQVGCQGWGGCHNGEKIVLLYFMFQSILNQKIFFFSDFYAIFLTFPGMWVPWQTYQNTMALYLLVQENIVHLIRSRVDYLESKDGEINKATVELWKKTSDTHMTRRDFGLTKIYHPWFKMNWTTNESI